MDDKRNELRNRITKACEIKAGSFSVQRDLRWARIITFDFLSYTPVATKQ